MASIAKPRDQAECARIVKIVEYLLSVIVQPVCYTNNASHIECIASVQYVVTLQV